MEAGGRFPDRGVVRVTSCSTRRSWQNEDRQGTDGTAGGGGTVDRLDVKWPCVQPLGVSPSRNTPAEVVF